MPAAAIHAYAVMLPAALFSHYFRWRRYMPLIDAITLDISPLFIAAIIFSLRRHIIAAFAITLMPLRYFRHAAIAAGFFFIDIFALFFHTICYAIAYAIDTHS